MRSKDNAVTGEDDDTSSREDEIRQKVKERRYEVRGICALSVSSVDGVLQRCSRGSLPRDVQSSKSEAEEGTDDRGRQQQAVQTPVPAGEGLKHTNMTGNGNCGTGLVGKRQMLLDDELLEDYLLVLPP